MVRVIERDGRDRLGEGPVWLPSQGVLLWVDIVPGLLHRLDLATGGVTTDALGEPLGWALPRRDRDDLVLGLKSGLATFDPATGTLTRRGDPEPDRPFNRMNDAKVDAAGRIWFGTKDDRDVDASGALYRLDADFGWTRIDDDYVVTNGPAFSLDGRTLYHTDSGRGRVYAFDLHEDGSLGERRVHIAFEDAWGAPDGMTTDAEGCLWVAHWGGGRLTRFDPHGTAMRSLPLPASNITSCTFAGADLDRMFVTSSTIGCEDEPLAGSLFEIDPGVSGVRAGAFAG